MNRLKTLFISSYVPTIGVIALVGIYQSLALGLGSSWPGVVLATLPVVIFVLAVSKYPTLRSHPWLRVMLTVLVSVGCVWAVYRYFVTEERQVSPMIAAILGWVGFLAFNFWSSHYGRSLNERLSVGRELPHFAAMDTQGGEVHSQELLGKPALFMFYRGNWCPFCSAQVQELTENYKELIKRGVDVALISPQPPDLTRRVAEMFDVPFRFWVDPDCAAARALGILHAQGVPYGLRKSAGGGDTVLPTVIIVDAQGKILFTDQTDNYRVRPEPTLFLRVLTEHGMT